ncbi:MAG: hypothetical protein KH230_01885 [Enterocloster asparagiformis]|nr:hypothetical protein [Enterocloster asparagiformis]
MEEPYIVKFFRIRRESIECFSDNTAPLVMGNFVPNQLCQAEVYENKIVITPVYNEFSLPKTPFN